MKPISVLVVALCTLAVIQGCGQQEATPPASSAAIPTVEASETVLPDQMPTAAPAISALKDSGEGYVASVNGQEISRTSFEIRFAEEQALFQQQPDYDLTSTAGQQALGRFRSGLLDRMIDEMLIEQVATAMGISIDLTELEATAAAMASQSGQELSSVEHQVRIDMYAKAVTQAVTADLPRVQPQVHVKQILAVDDDQAKLALDALDGGETWNSVASRYSAAPNATQNGGDLDYLPAGVMPPAFDTAAFALKPGEYSGVVHSETGIHIILMVERSEELPVPDAYWPAAQQHAFEEWLASYRKASIILMTQ